MTPGLASAVKSALGNELQTLHRQLTELVEPLTEDQFWHKPCEPGNSVGPLVLHLTGNLTHFLGACVGKTGYVRDREREFTEPNPPPRAEALARLDEAVSLSRRILE